MNNIVSLIANDASPLVSGPITLNHLSELKNVKEWMENEFTTYLGKNSLTMDDVVHRIQFLMGAKMVAKLNTTKIENTFGLIFHHAMTEEPLGDSPFSLVYVYMVDQTDASTEAYLAQAGPLVNFMDIKREVRLPAPHTVSIAVHKDVYQKFALALKTLGGSWLKSERERMALGMPSKFPIDEPNLMLAKTEYDLFMNHMDMRIVAAANSLRRGDNTTSLMRIIRQAPSVYTLPRERRFANVMDWCELVRRMSSSVPQMMFGVNKAVPGMLTAERNSLSVAMSEVFRLYNNHTDNSGAIAGLSGWFEGSGSPFRKPDMVIVTTDRLIQKLVNQGVCKVAEVDMKQVMTLLSLNQEDMHPLRTVVPQRSVTMKNGTYVRDANNQMSKKVHTTPNHSIAYSTVGGTNAVYVSVDDGNFAKDVARDAQLTTMSTFDFIMPAGIAMTNNNKVMYGPVQQTTTFTNEVGGRYTVSCEAIKPFLTNLFGNSEYATFEFFQEEDVDVIQQSMVFYTVDEPPEITGNGVSVRINKYVKENHYFNDDLMAMNIISVLMNRTAHALKDFFSDKAETGVDEAGKFNEGNVMAIVKNYLNEKKMVFDEAAFKDVYSRLLGLKNFDSLPFLRYVNIGFGLTFLKTQFVQADSMLLCKPSGFSHIGGVPSQTRAKDLSDDSQSILYKSSAYSTTCRQSLGGYPAVMWKNAMFAESQSTSSDKVLDVTSDDEITDHLTYHHMMKLAGVEQKTLDPRVKGDGWWPLITPPFMDIKAFGSVSSPLGRVGTPFKNAEEHEKYFLDPEVKDCIHPTVYTTNLVHANMWNNINTLCLYGKHLFENPDCPFYKYINYNPVAAAGIQGVVDANTRTNNAKMNMTRDESEGVDIKDEGNISEFLGLAIPKTCWSDMDMMVGVMSRDDVKNATSYRVNSVVTNGDTSFYINGHDFIGKWDRCGVSEYSFVH